ncbi:MAG: hypothetical protein AAB956_03010, partial [Patescibacteria group bacterium]
MNKQNFSIKTLSGGGITLLEKKPLTKSEINNPAVAGGLKPPTSNAFLTGQARIIIISLFATFACVGIIKATTTIGTNITTGGTITGSGTNTLYGATSIGGALTATSTLNVTGLTTLGNASTTALTVSGNSYLATTTLSGILNMGNNLIQNIGVAGTDFTGTGGLTLADALTVSSGGINATGDTTITGDLDVTSGVPPKGMFVTWNKTLGQREQGVTFRRAGVDGANITQTRLTSDWGKTNLNYMHGLGWSLYTNDDWRDMEGITKVSDPRWDSANVPNIPAAYYMIVNNNTVSDSGRASVVGGTGGNVHMKYDGSGFLGLGGPSNLTNSDTGNFFLTHRLEIQQGDGIIFDGSANTGGLGNEVLSSGETAFSSGWETRTGGCNALSGGTLTCNTTAGSASFQTSVDFKTPVKPNTYYKFSFKTTAVTDADNDMKVSISPNFAAEIEPLGGQNNVYELEASNNTQILYFQTKSTAPTAFKIDVVLGDSTDSITFNDFSIKEVVDGDWQVAGDIRARDISFDGANGIGKINAGIVSGIFYDAIPVADAKIIVGMRSYTGTEADFSDNGLNGTYTGTTINGLGVYGITNMMQFVRVDSVAVSFPDDADLSFVDSPGGTDGFSIMAWVNNPGLATAENVIASK